MVLRLLVWASLIILLAACSPAPGSQDESNLPTPVAPNLEHLNTGDPTRRPVVHTFGIAHYDLQEGWFLVPQDAVFLCVVATATDRVSFYSFAIESGENGSERQSLLGQGFRPPRGDTWCWGRDAGLTSDHLGIYAVAEGPHGSTVSPVIFAKGHDGAGYTSVQSPPPLPIWQYIRPATIDTSDLEHGDPSKRPVIHSVTVTHEDTRNGWILASADKVTVNVLAERANEVVIYGFDLLEELPDPDIDGAFGWPTRTASQPAGDSWTTTRHSPAGPVLGIYAVATNEYGRAVSEILPIAWIYED